MFSIFVLFFSQMNGNFNCKLSYYTEKGSVQGYWILYITKSSSSVTKNKNKEIYQPSK